MTSTALQLTENAEPIPGYRLIERIGVGGYGEVWKATAPGGLTKAIKFIFGRVGESRATRELKSLNHVKSLNHPFLLSLERIEIAGDHLMVVTEIADGSLRERFDKCAAQGKAGIPREELMRYLLEAADALDYLFDSQSLQHLDVKPENLLLLGGHIKVADFGLLKDLHDAGASLVGGLTPKYSSPEVFDGRPSRNSDQYSLAIVYQEMATGIGPFNGRTAAQLASQHLHSPPDLSPLTPHERFAVGKALSKDPMQRFASCREFVDRLAHRGATMIAGGVAPAPATGSPGATAGPNRGERSVFEHLAGPADLSQAHDGRTIVVTGPEVRSLPALELGNDAQIEYRPTVFVGIGGTGGKVLGRLRQLVSDRLGDASSIPALQFLLLDTDISSINEAVLADGSGALQESETVVLPLRNTWDYRSEELGQLDSISRRWLYNIPRSLRTQGLRALGRLALLDNAQRALESLRLAILTATAADSVAASAERTGLKFRHGDPRVCVVASLAGGTGGGMVIDIAYALRQILAETGLSDEDVVGLLTYSTSAGPMHRQLGAASALCCLDEIRYFSTPGRSYPGEPAVGLAGFQESTSPFRSTYYVDLGDDLSDDDFGVAVDRLASYLLHNTVSPASTFFDRCRKSRAESFGDALRLRTFGLSSFGAEDRRQTSQWVELLCNSVVRKWRGGIDSATRDESIHVSDIHRLLDACSGAPHVNADIERRAKKHVAEHGLTLEAIVKAVGVISDDALGRGREEYFGGIISESLDKASHDGPLPGPAIVSVLRTIDTIVDPDESQAPGAIEPLGETVFPRGQELGRRMGGDLQEWILTLVDVAATGLTGARQTGAWIKNYLQALREKSLAELRLREEEATVYRAALCELCDDSKNARRVKRSALLDNLLHYARLKMSVLTAKGTGKVLSAVEPHVTAAMDELRDFWKDLNKLSETFSVASADAEEPSTSSPASGMPLADVFDAHLPAMIELLDRKVKTDLATRRQGLRQVVNKNAQLHSGLIAGMRSAARQVILGRNRDVCLENLRAALKASDDDHVSQLILQWLGAAVPDLRLTGGAKRLLVAAPNAADGARIAMEVRRVLEEEVTLSTDPRGELIACCEVESLSAEGIAAQFVKQRPDCREMAARLHTRVNVDWRLC